MADTIVKKFVIDTGESEQNLKELNVQITATSTSVNKGAESIGNVAKAEEAVTASTKSLKAELRALQAQLATIDPGTEKYRELSIAAGELKDKIKDASEAVGTQAGSAFERVSGSLGLVTSRLLSLDFTGASEGAKLFAQNAGSLKLKDVSEGVKGLTSTLGSLGKALLTNPIFLLGGVIVGIIANFDALKNSGGALGKFFTGISDTVGFLKDSLLGLSDAIGLTNTKAAEEADKAAQRLKDALQGVKDFASSVGGDVQNKLNSIIETAGGNLEKARAKFKEYADQVKEQNQYLIDQANLIVERGGKLDEYQQARLDAAVKENAALDKALNDLNKQISDAAKRAADERRTREEKRAAEVKAIRDKELAEELARIEAERLARIKANEDRIKSEDAAFVLRQELTLSAQDKEIQAAVRTAEERLLIAGNDAELQKLITEQREADIAAIIAKYTQQNTDTVKAGTEETTQTTLEKIERITYWAERGLQVISALSDAYFANRKNKVAKDSKEAEDLARKQFRFNKALQLGGAIIDASKAITASLASAPVAIGPAPNPAGIASLALATTTGAAQVAKILATKFESPGTPPSTSPPPPPGGNEPPPAQFNPFAAQFINNRPGQALPRAYVLAGDVTNQQQVRENVENLSRIG